MRTEIVLSWGGVGAKKLASETSRKGGREDSVENSMGKKTRKLSPLSPKEKIFFKKGGGPPKGGGGLFFWGGTGFKETIGGFGGVLGG